MPLAMALLLEATTYTSAQPSNDYFPRDLRTTAGPCGVPILSDFEASWYLRQLSAANEASLYGESLDHAKSSTKAYRFTWLRSFHEPIIVRVDVSSDGEMRLTAKRLTGKGGYDPGRVGTTVQRALSAPEENKLRKLFNDNMAISPDSADCIIGSDGAEWILETRVGDSYHFAHRFMPNDGPVREIGLYLLSLTGWHIAPIY
jgi:hypothetical protein